MLASCQQKIKESISKAYLDWAEILPEFQGGSIKKLQTIRKRQRERGAKSLDQRRIPVGSGLILKQTTLVLAFQFEDFWLIRLLIKRLFPDSEDARKFVDGLKERETSLEQRTWSNLGLIAKDKKYLFLTQVAEKLPEHVACINVDYHKVLPSVTLLAFNFYIDEGFSDELLKIQNREYLPPVTFRNLIPFRKRFLSAYAEASGYDDAKKILRQRIADLIEAQKEWLQGYMSKSQQSRGSFSIIETYELHDQKSDPPQSGDMFSQDRRWLHDYGITDINSYKNGNTLYCSQDFLENEKVSHKLIRVKENKEDNSLGYVVQSLAVVSGLESIADEMRELVEKYRSYGYAYLNSYGSRLLRNANGVGNIKRISPLIKRLLHELVAEGPWLEHSVRNLHDLKNKTPSFEFSLDKTFADTLKQRLKMIRDASDIIDVGLTSYLEVQNIYVMYKLQVWLLILSIIVACAEWDNLEKLWDKITSSFIQLVGMIPKIW